MQVKIAKMPRFPIRKELFSENNGMLIPINSDANSDESEHFIFIADCVF